MFKRVLFSNIGAMNGTAAKGLQHHSIFTSTSTLIFNDFFHRFDKQHILKPQNKQPEKNTQKTSTDAKISEKVIEKEGALSKEPVFACIDRTNKSAKKILIPALCLRTEEGIIPISLYENAVVEQHNPTQPKTQGIASRKNFSRYF